MSAKNLMAVMILLSLLGYAESVKADPRIPLSATAGVRTDYMDANNIFSMGVNLFRQATGTLPAEDRNTHIKTVIFAASTLDNGQIAEWSNPANGTAGVIKVVLTKPVQGGYCRKLYTQVEKGGRVRDYTEYACRTIDSQFWTFSER
jgi:surface antigen